MLGLKLGLPLGILDGVGMSFVFGEYVGVPVGFELGLPVVEVDDGESEG